MASLDIRRLSTRDLSFAEQLRALAGWNQTRRDWERFLACEPDGCFLAEWDGAPAGTAVLTCYGAELAWVGMMLVHPDLRHRGIGARLLRHCLDVAEKRQIQSVKLDATPLGQPIYRQCGFEAELTLTRWERDQGRVDTPAETGPLRAVHQTDQELERIVELDQIAFGVDRARVLKPLIANASAAVVEEGDGGSLLGVGLLREGARAFYLGPVLAREPNTAERILRALLVRAQGRPVFWDVFDMNTSAVSLAKDLGFRPQRQLTRMFWKGNRPAPRPDLQYGIIDPAVG